MLIINPHHARYQMMSIVGIDLFSMCCQFQSLDTLNAC